MVSAKNFTTTAWDQDVLAAPVPVLADFGAAWCPHCQHMQPIVEDLAEQMEGQAIVGFVDTDREHALAQRYGVHGLPTCIVFRNGKEVHRHVGESSFWQLQALLGTQTPRHCLLVSPDFSVEPRGQDLTTIEQVRAAILDGDERLISSPAWRFLSDQQKRLLLAGKEFWQRASAVTTAALVDILSIYQGLGKS